MKTLTWYPGTILPYASLWHTLLRVTWLNDLRAGELREMVLTRKRRKVMRPPEVQAALNLKAVAAVLGELGEAFSKVATIEQFPPILQGSLTENVLRWCPECIAGGFHTLLGSIRLISRCPIHSVPMISACAQCGDRFAMRMRGLAVRPIQCRCGASRFVEPRAIRTPSLQRQDVAAWAPVERWVRQVRDVGYSTSVSSRILQQSYLAFAERWSRDLGLDYPECFDAQEVLWPDAEEPGRWSTYHASSGDLRGLIPRDDPNLATLGSKSPGQWVYRAIGRHFRRHGMANPDRWIKARMHTFDPATFAISMAALPRVRAAFTEMLWARRLEPTATDHRWPNRASPMSTDADLSHYTPVFLDQDIAQTALRDAHSLSRRRRWVDYHAMVMEARLAWDRACRQTRRSIEDGWADWLIEERERGDALPAGRAVWFCRPKVHGMQFVGYIRDGEPNRFSAGMPTKQQRREALADIRLKPRRRLEGLAHQPCLGWNSRNGWHVTRGALPDDDDVRRVRLLHTGARTSCWVFRSESRFVARLEGGGIQVSGASAHEALSSLRGAVLQYRRTYAGRLAAPR